MTGFLSQSSWFIPLYGIIGTLLTLPWSLGGIRRTGPRPAAYLNLLMTLIAFIHGSIVFFWTWQHPSPVQIVFPWLQIADLDLSIAIEISPVNMGALELVAGMSLLAQLFALGYMEKDWSLARFYGLMGFFEAALSAIAISDSLFVSYALLEALTLSTYLLVGFWYAQPLVVTAARDAFLTKRVGDITLLMGIVALSSLGATFTFSELESWAATAPLPPLTAALIGLALIAGPTGKCAQFPLNLWLDEAMEGPNPASIMRNSIVVSAGAYVLIKLQPVLALSDVASNALVILGILTSVGASLMAIAQIDLKRALSHSTSAYLGLVFVAVGLQQVDIALLLLLTHAVTKALLFMSAGSVILNTSCQNITELGGLWSRMPATASAFVMGSAGLVALVPIATFWVMRRWVNGFWDVPWWLLLLLIAINTLSAFNLTRVFRSVFLGDPQPKTRRSPETTWPMAFPMVSLIVVTAMMPWILQRWQLLLSWTGPWTTDERVLTLVAMPLIASGGFVGCLVALAIPLPRNWARSAQRNWRFAQDFLAYDFYIDRLYRLSVVWLVRIFSTIANWFDRYILDGAINLVGFVAIFGGQALRYNVSGQSQFYLLTIVTGVAILFLLMAGMF